MFYFLVICALLLFGGVYHAARDQSMSVEAAFCAGTAFFAGAITLLCFANKLI